MTIGTRRIEIKPITRVEGHGSVTLQLDEAGKLTKAHFNILQLRGFEKFLEGRVFWEMPMITPRICGICPVSHHLAAVKACDVIYGAELPPTAKKLRLLMHMAQMVQSHALHFFHLASPDFIFGMDGDPATRNVFGIIDADPELAKKAVRLRSFGQTIISTLGEKKVHPNHAVPGGVNKALSEESRIGILREVDDAIAGFQLAISIFKDIGGKLGDTMNTFGSLPTAYLGLVDPKGNLAMYDGKLKLVGSNGSVLEDQFDCADYLSIIEEHVEDWSYMKFPYYSKHGYPGGMYRVGPLARLNVATGITTPLANEEFKQFKKVGKGGMVEGSLYYHYARLIEGLYAAEMIKELAEDKSICSTDLRASSGQYRSEGVGVIEAPRGTLIHHYWADERGTVQKANIVVATGHNNLAINQAIFQVARDYVKADKLTEGMLNRVEATIRCYDPCLSCATHAIGHIAMSVRLVGPGGEVVHQVDR
jgi:NAD-reducing hydrogenase large subunit